jgi:hypothetical protein
VWTSRGGFFCALLALALPVAPAQAADEFGLIPYPESGCTGACAPLILIHGIHGTGVDEGCAMADPVATDGKPVDCYWWPLIDHLKKNNTAVWRKTRIYIYRYLSDRDYDTIRIGKELRARVDALGLRSNLVLVAHSMGGIVARNFLDYQPAGSNVRGYDMTTVLLTLATPHHGTPIANREWRNWTANTLTNSVTPAGNLDFFDFVYWSVVNSKHLIKNPGAPSRSDLRWDDYDGLFAAARQHFGNQVNEENPILRSTFSTTNARKIIAYAGYMDPKRFTLIDDFPRDLEAYLTKSGWSPAQSAASEHRYLEVFATMMAVYLKKNENDGMVPIDSSRFDRNPYVAARRTFWNYDHADMKGNKPGIDARALTNGDLFFYLNQDLDEVLRHQGPPPQLLAVSLLPATVASGSTARLAYKIRNSQDRTIRVALKATVKGYGGPNVCSVQMVEAPPGQPVVYRDLAIPSVTQDALMAIAGELWPADESNPCGSDTTRSGSVTVGNILAGQTATTPPTIALRLPDASRQDYHMADSVKIEMVTTAGTGNNRVFVTLRSDGPNGRRYYRYGAFGQLEETADPAPVAPPTPALNHTAALSPVVITSSTAAGTYLWRAAMYRSEVIAQENLLAESAPLTYRVIGGRAAAPSVTGIGTSHALYKTGDTMTIYYTTVKGSATGPYDLMLRIRSKCSGNDYYFYDDKNDSNRWIHPSPQPMWTGAAQDGDFQIPDGSMPPILIDDDTPSGEYHMTAYFSEKGRNTPAGNSAESDFQIQTAKDGCGCFIATAAYGSPMASSVGILRSFRDTFLLAWPWGRTLVREYYRAAPPLAHAIEPHPLIRKAVRAVLWPAIAFSAVSLRAGVWLSLLLFTGILCGLAWWMRRATVKVRAAALGVVLAAAACAGEIRGTVVRAKPFPAPVPGAQVATDQQGVSGISGEDGSFRIANVAPGSVRLTVTAPGYMTATGDVQVSAIAGAVTVAVASMTPGAARTYEYYIPHTAESDSWSTFVGLLNGSSVGADVAFSAYDGSGRFLASSPKLTRLGIHQQAAGAPSAFFPGLTGQPAWYKVTSTSPLSGFALFTNPSGAIAGLPLATGDSGSLAFPHVPVDAQWWTSIAVVSAGTQTAEVHLQARDGSGNLLAEAARPTLMAPGSRTAGTLDGYFGSDFPLGIEWAGVTAGGRITGLGLFGQRNQESMAAVPALAQGAKKAWFPHLALTDGWWTAISLLNLDTRAGTVRLTAYDDKGTAVAVSRDIVLGPGEKTAGTAESYFGSLRAEARYLELASPVQVAGFEVVGRSSPSALGSMAALTAPGKDLGFAYAPASKDWSPVITLINTGDAPARVTFGAQDASGARLSEAKVTVPPHGAYAGALGAVFSNVPPAAAWLQASSDGPPLVGFVKLARTGGVLFLDLPAEPVAAAPPANTPAKPSAVSRLSGYDGAAELIQTRAAPGGGVAIDWPAWLDHQATRLSGGRVRRGDVILAVNGEKVSSREDLLRLAAKWRRASSIEVRVRDTSGGDRLVRLDVPR